MSHSYRVEITNGFSFLMSGVNNEWFVTHDLFSVQIKCGVLTLVHRFECKQRVVITRRPYILD